MILYKHSECPYHEPENGQGPREEAGFLPGPLPVLQLARILGFARPAQAPANDQASTSRAESPPSRLKDSSVSSRLPSGAAAVNW